MVRIARARPTEFLVTSRKGRLRNVGLGRRCLLLPGGDFVTVPAVKQEAAFAMTQESRDGIPLRFKGIVVFSVSDPVRAASCFDFAGAAGIEQLQALIAHVCLGELRDRVSRMAMSACIEERKTSLSAAVEAALREVADQQGASWGINIDLVQIAQVFIVDDELRARLEAEVRDELQARSERSHIEMQEAVQRARLASERRLAQEALETERERAGIETDKLALQEALETRRIEIRGPLRRKELEDERATLEVALATRRQANEVRALEVRGELLQREAEAAIEREMLPLRQVPAVAEALSKVFHGAKLSLYGNENELLRIIQPLVDAVGQRAAD